MEGNDAKTCLGTRHDMFAGAVPVFLPLEDRFTHMFAVGQTGTGKSTFLERCAIDDVAHGLGITFIDPHGTSACRLLDHIPPERINDVVYVNPADRERAVGFNILQRAPAAERDRITQEVVGTFRYLWSESWGPRMDWIFKNAVRALLDAPARYGETLLGLPRLFNDPHYRARIVRHVDNPNVRHFWVHEFESWDGRQRSEYVLPIRNKVEQFLLSDTLRLMLGQAKSTIDLTAIMDRRKILIVNLDKGQLGEDDANLLGSLLVTGLYLAAMRRSAVGEEQRVPHLCYLDEFHSFATRSFAAILSETRKYKLGLVLASQYLSQMHDDIRDAVFGNCGVIASYRVGGEDAAYLTQHVAWPARQLVDLARGETAMRVVRRGKTETFRLTTQPLSEEAQHGHRASIIRQSQSCFAVPSGQIEARQYRWLTA